MIKIFVFFLILFKLINSSPFQHRREFLHHHEHPIFLQTIDQNIINFEEQLQSLQPNVLDYFVRIYHRNNNEFVQAKLAQAQDGAYFYYVGKMYLYGLLQNPKQIELKNYETEARHLAAYFYLKTAAQRYGNRQAYYLIGLLQQLKMVPDKIIEGNLQNIQRDKTQQFLYKYLKTSHLNNGEHMLYMSAGQGYDPAALVLAHMNRQPFGTTQNCTTSLAYYLAVLKRSLFEPYIPKLAFEVHDSLEEELFARKKLQIDDLRKDYQFIVQTTYFDEQTISATLEQANRYYTGSGGVMRDLSKALNLYQKLSHQGNNDGKVMAGLMYFRGEGAPRNVYKSRALFQQSSKDEVAEYMLLAMDYFQITGGKTKEKALLSMKNKYMSKKKLTHLMNYLIGAAALKGEIKEISYDQAIQMIDKSAAEGNPSSRILMAILFTDGAKGLKYGCPEATKYLSEDANSFPYFRKRVNSAQVAIKRGFFSFAFYKYLQLSFNNYQAAFVNLLYLIENYKDEALDLNQNSWLPSKLAQSAAYKNLRKFNYVPQIYSFLSAQYSPIGTNSLKVGQLEKLLTANEKIIKTQLTYMMRKIIKRGVLYESKGVLKYYQMKMLVQQGSDQGSIQQALSSLASGDSSKLYVSQARYLLGKLYHQRFLKNKTALAQKERLRVLGEYNRAVKSQILGKIIFEIEQYQISGQLGFTFGESEIGQDLLSYIFVVAILIFALYYIRSKRFDHFHRVQLERQLKKAQQEQTQVVEENQQNISTQQIYEQQQQQQEDNRNQPIITEDLPKQTPREVEKGIRIGSSQEDGSV